MRKNLALLLLIFFVAGGCYFLWARYDDSQHGFSLLFPRFWERQDNPRVTVMVLAPLDGPRDTFRENINVIASEFPNEEVVKTFYDFNKAQILASFPGSQSTLEESEIFAGTLRGRLLSFEALVGSHRLQIFSAVWTKGRWTYVISCTCEKSTLSRYEPVFQKVMKSLRLK